METIYLKYHVTKDFTILSEMHYMCYQVFEQPLRLSVTMTNYRTTFFCFFTFLYLLILLFPTYSYMFELTLVLDMTSWPWILLRSKIYSWPCTFSHMFDSYSVICLTRGLDPSPCLCLFPPVSALPCLFLHPTGLQDVLYPQIEFWTFFCKHNTCTDMLKL